MNLGLRGLMKEFQNNLSKCLIAKIMVQQISKIQSTNEFQDQ